MGAGSKWRQRLVGFLAVLTCVLLFISLVGFWVQRTIYDTDRWVALVEDLPSDPAVAQGIANRLTDEIVALTNPEQKIREALPPQASVLAGPITTALESLVTQAVADVIASDQFRTVWVAINRFAHEEVIRLLDGDGGVVSADDGKVVLNLLPVVSEVLDRVPSGLLGQGSPPDIPADMPKGEARQRISSYLGVTLPEEFGQVEVFESDNLATVQRALAAFNRLVVIMAVLTVAFGAATIALSQRRRRTVLELGLGAVVAVAASWVILRVLSRQVVDSLGNERAGQIAGTIFNVLLSDLRATTAVVLVIGVVTAIVAFLLGDSRPARWTQDQLRSARDTTTAAAMKTSQGGSAAAWTARNEVGMRVGGGIVAVAVLLLFNISWAWLLCIAVLLAIWQLAISGLVHLARQDPSAGSPAST